ncbi:MAG TPA: hypothetical protein VHO95_05960, partial [Candidatus Dormibacteraeota bacterium]|nr:hypothetical protein [Candidatus Dormibacteraeota bacterium]
LPWIGIVCGGGYVVLGILQTVVIFTLALVMGFVPVLLLAELLYAIWAIWMGVHLTRAKSPAAAMTTAPAAN